MAALGELLIAIVVLFAMRATRPYAIAGAVLLVGYILWDNYVTEGPLKDFTVQSSSAYEMISGSDPVYHVAVRLKNNDKKATLETANVELELRDCTMGVQIQNCRLLGHQTKNVQFLADSGEVKEAEIWYYFNHVAPANGNLITVVKVVDANGDWF